MPPLHVHDVVDDVAFSLISEFIFLRLFLPASLVFGRRRAPNALDVPAAQDDEAPAATTPRQTRRTRPVHPSVGRETSLVRVKGSRARPGSRRWRQWEARCYLRSLMPGLG